MQIQELDREDTFRYGTHPSPIWSGNAKMGSWYSTHPRAPYPVIAENGRFVAAGREIRGFVIAIRFAAREDALVELGST